MQGREREEQMVAEDKTNTSEVIKKTLLRLLLEKESSLDKIRKYVELKI